MADSYVDGKVREALAAARGSRSVAQNLLMNWAVDDDRLLRGMAQPFFKAITAAALEGVLRREATAGKTASPHGGARLSRDALEQGLARMGEQTHTAAPGGKPIQAATMMVGRSGAAPAEISHEDAMKTLAKAFAAKKLR
jgi:hypothetical protein